jgi:NhaA family Na+:H+ antiporter
LQAFVHLEAAGGLALFGATLAALVWANSPWDDAYTRLWNHEIGFDFAGIELHESIGHWINDGLMTLFFFVVGLEIKRETTSGELSSRRAASLPVFGAFGGMIVPAVIYTAFNAGGEGRSGWAIPMATDIAFALGVLALLGSRIPSGLKAFLLALAIVDDIGAILVIAAFYSGDIAFPALIAAGGLILVTVAVNLVGVRAILLYLALGVGLWYAMFQSGIHATLAGVILGLLTPERPHAGKGETEAPLDRLERMLHPWSTFLVIPLFALANAGLSLSADVLADAIRSPIAIGIVLGLVVGKTVGISSFAWFAVRLGLSQLPAGTTWRQVVGTALLGGIGFTVSLFITALAFDDGSLVQEAKAGIFAASVLAGTAGFIALRLLSSPRPTQTVEAEAAAPPG